MFVVGSGPGEEDGESPGLVALDKGANGELGGAEAGEKAERVERRFKIVEAVLGDEVREEDADKAGGDARGEGAENGELIAKGKRKREGDGFGGAAHAGHELSGGQTGERVRQERVGVERGERAASSDAASSIWEAIRLERDVANFCTPGPVGWAEKTAEAFSGGEVKKSRRAEEDPRA